MTNPQPSVVPPEAQHAKSPILAARAILAAERARRRVLPVRTTRVVTLHEFTREAWAVVEPSTPYMHGKHIDVIIERLMAVFTSAIWNLVINIPPRYMKSLLVSVFWMAWSWTVDPGMRWLYTSYDRSLSIRDSVKCRRLITSPWYQEHWGHVFALTGDQNQKMRFENDRTGYRIASSVDAGNTGEGGDIIVADDPHNMREIDSQATRESVLGWWDNVMTSRSGRAARPRKVIVMQRGHQADLSGHVLLTGQYVHLRMPQEYEPTPPSLMVGDKPLLPLTDPLGDPEWRTEPGALLWPERFDAEAVAAIKAGGISAYHYAGQYQQRPSPAEGGIFPRHLWRFWEPADQSLGLVSIQMPDGSKLDIAPVKLPDRFIEAVQSWDMTFKEKRTSDFVAGHVWARAAANAYMLARVHRRMDFVRTVQAVLDWQERWGHLRKLVEDAANGPAVISALKSQVPGLVAVPAEGDKVARAYSVTYLHEGGNLFLPHPLLFPWVWDIIETYAAFNNAAYDDDVDAGVQALRHLFRKIPKGVAASQGSYSYVTG